MKLIRGICTIIIVTGLLSSFNKKQAGISAQHSEISTDTSQERWKKFIDLNTYTRPFWFTDTITDETVQLIRDSNVVTSTLLFNASEILSVKAANYSKEFIRGKDWDYSNGKLIFGPESRVPFFHKEDLVFTKEIPGRSMGGSIPGTYVLFNEGYFFSARQIAVTYVKDKNQLWKGPVPRFAETTLPNSISKLNKNKHLKIVFLGNSIEVGYNASGLENVPPYMPTWPELVVNKLKKRYKGDISFANNSVAGRLAQWGRDSVATRVISERPDLVVIGFGMNDGTLKVSPDVYREQIKGIIDSVTIQNSNAEFILIAPMVANPASGFTGFQRLYKKELDKLTGKGIVVADLTGVHEELLKRKSYQDMTGNNINHPNDYLARWYAQFICGLLIP